jgi:shikimate dehydrogenase
MPAQRHLYGLFGDPVAHSLSPLIHAAAFAELSPEAAYLPFEVPAGRLAEAVAAARLLGVRGLNVTTPHKEAIPSLLDDLDGDASAIGAVNVVARRGERLVGFNTDTGAVRTAVEERHIALAGLPALVLGAGGAARAAAHALASLGTEVRIHNRSAARAEALASSIRAAGGRAYVTGDDDLAALLRDCAAVVQATSVGFHDAASSPLADGLPFARGALALELVYRPLETRFGRQARASGAAVVDGLELLVRQALLSLEVWLERDLPMDLWLPRLRAKAMENLS